MNSWIMLFVIIVFAILASATILMIAQFVFNYIRAMLLKIEAGAAAHQFLLQQQQQTRMPAPPPGKVIPIDKKES
jgi:hypothetical protein